MVGGPAVDYIVLPVFWILVTVQTGGGENRVAKVRSPGPVPCHTRFLRFLYRTGEQVRPPLSFFFANRFENRDAPREKRGGARINRFFDFSATNGPNATRKREGGGGRGLVIGLHRTGESESGWSIDKALLGRAWESSLPCSPPARGVATRGGRKSGGKKKGTFVRLFCPCKVASIPLPNLQTVT